MNRLQILSPELLAKFNSASTAKQRAACVAACELAVAKAQVEDALVSESLAGLRSGRVFTAEERARIDALAADLDERYFNLQDAAEEGKADVDDVLRAFEKARAVAAISLAGSDDPEAASEAIYEAAIVLDEDQSSLFARIESLL